MFTRASRSDLTLNQRKPQKPAEPNDTTETTKRTASAFGLVRELRRSSSGSRLIEIIGAASSGSGPRGESRRDAERGGALEQGLVVEPGVVEVEALDGVPGHGATLEDAPEDVPEAGDARAAARDEDLLDLAVRLVLVVVEAELDLVAEVLEARQHRFGHLGLAAAGLALELLALEGLDAEPLRDGVGDLVAAEVDLAREVALRAAHDVDHRLARADVDQRDDLAGRHLVGRPAQREGVGDREGVDVDDLGLQADAGEQLHVLVHDVALDRDQQQLHLVGRDARRILDAVAV